MFGLLNKLRKKKAQGVPSVVLDLRLESWSAWRKYFTPLLRRVKPLPVNTVVWYGSMHKVEAEASLFFKKLAKRGTPLSDVFFSRLDDVISNDGGVDWRTVATFGTNEFLVELECGQAFRELMTAALAGEFDAC